MSACQLALVDSSAHSLAPSCVRVTSSVTPCALSPVETREWVEELSSPSELHAASRSNRAKLALAQQSVDAAFRAGDFAAMKSATIRLSFLTNIEEEIYKRMPVA